MNDNQSELKWYLKQPANLLIGALLLLSPSLIAALLLGEEGFLGAAIYMLTLFLVGSINVTWIPLRQRLHATKGAFLGFRAAFNVEASDTQGCRFFRNFNKAISECDCEICTKYLNVVLRANDETEATQ